MKSEIRFICNNEIISSAENPAAALLDFLRKKLKLTGTKEGCREGDCGACAVLIGENINGTMKYKSVNSCLTPLFAASGKHIVTIEGLNQSELSPIQKIFVEEGATQCGFCSPGFIISLTGYLLSKDNVNKKDAADFIAGNLCRCTGHVSILRAIDKIFDSEIITQNNNDRISFLIENKFIPSYFSDIPQKLKSIHSEEEKLNLNFVFRIAGGTDVYVQKGKETLLHDVNFITNGSLDSKIKVEDGFCCLSASTTVSEFADSEIIQNIIPEIKTYLKLFGSTPIRNRATLGGNIVNASPIADMTNILLALNVSLLLVDDKNNREVSLHNFYRGYKQLDKTPSEVLKEIRFKIPTGNYKINFEKVSKRTHLDIASVNSTCFIVQENDKIIEARISAGGVSPIPLLLKETSAFLQNKILSEDLILEASEIIMKEISPISDARGSADYKRLLLQRLFFAHFLKLFPSFISEEIAV